MCFGQGVCKIIEMAAGAGFTLEQCQQEHRVDPVYSMLQRFCFCFLVFQDYCASGLEGYENFIAVTVSIYRQNMLVAGIIAGCVVLFISVAWTRLPYAVWQFTRLAVHTYTECV